MSDNNDFITIAELQTKLQALCDQKRTGRLVTLSDNSVFFYIDLLDGEIVSVKFQQETGVNALAEISDTVKHCKPVFAKATQPVDDSANLPSTQDILNSLVSGVAANAIDDDPTSVTQRNLNDDINAQLTQLFAEYIGPMADIVGGSVIDQYGATSTAIAELSSNIADDDQATEFLERAQRLIGIT